MASRKFLLYRYAILGRDEIGDEAQLQAGDSLLAPYLVAEENRLAATLSYQHRVHSTARDGVGPPDGVRTSPRRPGCHCFGGHLLPRRKSLHPRGGEVATPRSSGCLAPASSRSRSTDRCSTVMVDPPMPTRAATALEARVCLQSPGRRGLTTRTWTWTTRDSSTRGQRIHPDARAVPSTATSLRETEVPTAAGLVGGRVELVTVSGPGMLTTWAGLSRRLESGLVSCLASCRRRRPRGA